MSIQSYYGSTGSIRTFKNCQKSWRTCVRPDISSTFCRFELMSGRTNVLDPFWYLVSKKIHDCQVIIPILEVCNCENICCQNIYFTLVGTFTNTCIEHNRIGNVKTSNSPCREGQVSCLLLLSLTIINSGCVFFKILRR